MQSIAFSTPTDAPRWKRWLMYSPVARILIFVAMAGLLGFVAYLVAGGLGLNGREAAAAPRRIALFLRQVVPLVGAYLLLVYLIERRRPTELEWRKVLRDTLPGLLLGAALISLVVGVLWLAGSYQVTGNDPAVNWWPAFLIGGLGAAVAEEIVFRGVLFRITEEGLGTWPALALSALLFGLTHLGNKGATVWSSAAIAIEAGLMLGLAYHVTRSLPLCMGIHLGWNFAQGTVFGIPVSGIADPAWLISTRNGPDWLTGGPFGAEASVVAVAVCSLVTAALLARALKVRSIVVRRWRTRPIMDARPSQGAPC
jgi:membrane protease YdiL (CAAX protease family)